MPKTRLRRRGTAIVEYERQGRRGVLVHADDEGNWLLPGGGLNRDSQSGHVVESRLAAAARELREETGLEPYGVTFLFRHETSSNEHKVFYVLARGEARVVDPNEAPALGVVRDDMTVEQIAAQPGFDARYHRLMDGSATIIERYRSLRRLAPALFHVLDAAHLAPGSDALSPAAGKPAVVEPALQLLDRLNFTYRGASRAISIYYGDLTALPASEAVDLLVISALPDNYAPAPQSLIGALHRKGVSVEALSQHKAADMRPNLACWLSGPVQAGDPGIQFRRILCFEPRQRGAPPEVVGDIFQCLISVSEGGAAVRRIAMPLLGGGVQGVSTAEMLIPLFDAATHWMQRGLPVEELVIVAHDELHAAELRGAFGVLKRQFALQPPDDRSGKTYDLFISYSWKNKDAVDAFVAELRKLKPGLRLFLDRQTLQTGCAWQQDIFAALDDCRKIITFYSPDYLASKVCREEYNIALFRQRNEGGEVLLPVFLDDTPLPTYM